MAPDCRIVAPIISGCMPTSVPCPLLLAGGIGITPIKAMAQALAARGTGFQLHYAGRNRGKCPIAIASSVQLGERLSAYSGAEGERMDWRRSRRRTRRRGGLCLRTTAPHQRRNNCKRALGMARERVRLELFA
ncbi:MAG: hypothetical protein R3E50_12180 [Halioglobus sp.]